MLKKSLLSLAVAASLGVTGCNISSTSGNADADSVQPDVTPEELAAQRGVFPIFDPANGAMPLGIDLILASASATDGTANTNKAGQADESPVTNAIDLMDGGIGVLNPIDIPMSGSITTDATVLATSVYLIQLTNASTDNNLDATADSPLTDALNIFDIVGIQGPDGNADGSPDDPRISAVEEIMTGAASIPTATQTAGAAKIKVEAISVDGGTNNVLRISPLEPLKPKTKYIVAVLKQLQDASGNQINSDINYEKITGTEQLSVSSFEAVRGALNGWEQVATGAITSVVQALNASADAVTADDLAITSSFTTVSTDSVLLGMATAAVGGAPSWMEGAVISSIKSSVRESDEYAGSTDYAAVWDKINADYAGVNASGLVPTQQTALATDILTSTTYESPQPKSRTTQFFPAALTLDNTDANLPNGGFVSQGQITLPYYLGIPTRPVDGQTSDQNLAAAAAIQNTVMAADSEIDDIIEDNLAELSAKIAVFQATSGQSSDATAEQIAAAKTALPTIPPADADGNSYVNGRYPFAQKTGDVNVPILVHMPDAANNGTADCGGTTTLCPVVIYVHGIGGNRSHSLSLANGGLSAASVASIAIDLPLHGVAPLVQGADDSALGFSVDSASSVNLADPTKSLPTLLAGIYAQAQADNPFENLGERHFGYGTSATGASTPLVYDDLTTTSTDEADVAFKFPVLTSNNSGAAFINLGNFAVTRDLMRQAVMDLLNVAASIGDMDVDGDGNPDFDPTKVHVVGHSLGGILATTFVNTLNSARAAGVTALPAVNTVSLIAAGGGLARVLENSPSFAGSISASPISSDGMTPNAEFGLLAKLNANGVTQGTSNFESFLKVFQATIDSVDPMAIAKGTALAAQPILAIEIIGDGTETNLPDQTVPNGFDGTTVTPFGNATNGYLYGTEPLVNGPTTTVNSQPLPDTGLDLVQNSAVAGGGARQVLKLTQGGHSTILTGDDALSQAVQIEAIASFIGGNGAGINVTTTNAATIIE